MSETGTDDSGHGDSITTLVWIKSPESASKYLVASSGLDGKILLWQIQERNSQMILIKGFLVLAENLPRSLRPQKKLVSGEVGVTSMSFSFGDPATYFLGLEGGGVVQCSLNSSLRTHGSIGNVHLMSPIVLAFDQHPGYVSSIGCAPFGPHLFATCASDGELRIYSGVQVGAPVVAVHAKNALASLSWSPCRPTILATVSTANEVLIFNLQNVQNGPDVVEVSTSTSGEFCIVKFNYQNFRLMATANTRSEVEIWQLSKDFTTGSSHETSFINNLGRNGD